MFHKHLLYRNSVQPQDNSNQNERLQQDKRPKQKRLTLNKQASKETSHTNNQNINHEEAKQAEEAEEIEASRKSRKQTIPWDKPPT